MFIAYGRGKTKRTEPPGGVSFKFRRGRVDLSSIGHGVRARPNGGKTDHVRIAVRAARTAVSVLAGPCLLLPGDDARTVPCAPAPRAGRRRWVVAAIWCARHWEDAPRPLPGRAAG